MKNLERKTWTLIYRRLNPVVTGKSEEKHTIELGGIYLEQVKSYK